MYTQQKSLPKTSSYTCPECGSNRFIVNHSLIKCTNCDYSLKQPSNKYGAKRTLAQDGISRDSKYEASVADQLLLRKKIKDIKDYDSQYKVEMWIYRSDGTRAFKVQHKVDFRIHHKDGSYELVEAKGVETADYKWRRRLLEELWLPEHKDHIYTVVKQTPNNRLRRPRRKYA